MTRPLRTLFQEIRDAHVAAGQPGAPVPFPVGPFARDCLLRGVGEPGCLPAHEPKSQACEAAHA